MGLILTGTSVGGLAEAACASNHITASLVGLPPEAISRPFFYSAEPESGSTDALFTIRVFGDDCSQPTIGVDYATGGGTAQPGTDYTITAGRAQLALPVHEQVIQTIPIPVQSDDSLESVVESTDIVLSNPSGARLAEPFSAPLFIIDSDGPSSRVALDGGAYAQSESQSEVRIPVFRAGAAAGPATVSYSITPGGTNPAQGADYVAASPGTVSFAPGERVKTIDFSLVNDDVADPSETVTVLLTGAEVVAPSTTSFTILDNEEGFAPTSKLHHPRHRWRYSYNDYRVREIHVFTKDEGGSGVVQVELALRRRLKSGKCAWWNGKRFRGGDCSEKVWRHMKVYEPGFFYYYRIKALAPSVKTRIMNYTAYARATDGAGNVESLLQPRRNRNTFEIKRKAA